MRVVQGSSATASTVRSNSDAPDHDGSESGVRTLGKYELLRLIARGGMGEVHLARLPGELGFEKRLVIKTIRAELASDPRFVEMFAAEAKTAVALSHPNIAPIYELGRAADGTLYTAMGWVDGPSLHALLARLRTLDRTLELGAALFITRELLDGLAHAHSRDRDRPPVVHRDITPGNVLVDRSGRVQIVDFGIARPAEAEVGGLMGSAGYMAPEQARGELVDPRADVFSVGCVLYELLTNERAFGEGVWMLPSLARVPEPVAGVLERSLALEPRDRFVDAAEFLRALAPILAEHAPAFGTRDLATILAELFGDGWEPPGPRDSERTPATAVNDAVETFATRAVEKPAVAQANATPDPASHDRRARAFWPWMILLAIATGVGGYLLAQPEDRPHDSHDEPPEPATRDTKPEQEPPADQPKPEPPEPVDPIIAAASVTLELSPADAQVFVDGEALGDPPHTIALAGDKIVELRVEHPDYRPDTRTLDPATVTAGGLRIELEPLESGSLTVLAPSVAWAEVWLDGDKLGTTPLKDKAVIEGKHKLEVRCVAAVCGTAAVLLAQTIRVRPGRNIVLAAEADQ
jgi:serine/threonine protein kinase